MRRRVALTSEGGHARLYLLRLHLLRPPKGAASPHTEEMIVVTPGTIADEYRANFARQWHELVEQRNLFHFAAERG